MLWIYMLHIFAAPVETMHTGHHLGLGDSASPLPSSSWTPNMPPGSTLLGPSPLVRGMSGSGLGRLQRVGSNPINDMNRHSFSQVLSITLCMYICMYICMYVCMHQSFLGKSWISAKPVLVAACSTPAADQLHAMLPPPLPHPGSHFSMHAWHFCVRAMLHLF